MTDHYFTSSPETEHQRREIRFDIEDLSFVFSSDSSVFSKDHVDEGSELLIKTVLEHERELMEHDRDQEIKGLDLGTGYGVIGIVLSSLLDVHMTMTDVNQRSLDLAITNAFRHKVVENTKIKLSDGFESLHGHFDLIVSNPPIRAGKQVIYKMWEDAVEHLNTDGRFYIVIRKQQGAPSALKKLQELSQDVQVLVKRKGFWVIRLVKEDISA